ncbi:MAG: HD domain-containing protein [Candidatus Peribacteraceae bacterium]|nr:HD domain-containing protein [Candidatus Peribacteraceae bacterium]
MDTSYQQRPLPCTIVTCHLDPLVPSFAAATPLTMGDYLTYRDAISFARRAHEGQKRADGRPFVSHPLAVLQILRTTSVDLPPAAYVAALLHDTVEDGKATLEQIRAAFGEETTDAVDALTRGTKPKAVSVLAHEQAYLDHMIAVHERLPYVLLIKMADRLHNLETSHYLAPGRRLALLHETITLYLPLFRRQEALQTTYAETFGLLCSMLEESALRLTERPAKPFTKRQNEV